MKAVLLLCFAGLIAGCGYSSNSISIVGPPAPTLMSISITPVKFTLQVGASQQFTATGSYSDGSQQDITATVTWSSSAASVASISNVGGSNGLATGVGAGSTTITAASGTLSGSTTLTVTTVTLVSIGVTPAAPTIVAGTTQQFTATGVYSDNSMQNLTGLVTWHAVNPAVASITTALGNGGLATGVGPGTTQITATLGGVVGSTNLTVTAAALRFITVTPPDPSIPRGTVLQLTATGTYSNNTTQNLTGMVTWAPAASTIATVSNAAGTAGQATALGLGTVMVTATLGAVTGTTMLTVTPAILVSIAVTAASTSIANSTTEQLTATGMYSDGSTQNLTTQVTWAPTTGAIASVSNAVGSQGLVTALDPGSVTVTATLGATVGTIGLTVTGSALVSITVTPAPATIRTGPAHSLQFTATGNYANLSMQDITAVVTWKSATLATATISNAAPKGLATGLAPGTTLITATLGAITSNAATLTVIEFAYAANYLSNNVSQFLIGPGGTLTAIGTGTVPAGANPYALAVDPTYNYVYVANFDKPGNLATTISQYAIQAGGALAGALTVIGAGSVPATGFGPNGITVSPTGPYVYTANFDSNNVTLYTIGIGGALAPGVTAAAGSGAAAIALNPMGTYAYVANFNDGTVSEYSVSGVNGTLTPLGTVPAEPSSPSGGPNAIGVDPTGHFVYVANNNDNSVWQYSIGAGGILTQIAPAMPAGAGAQSITFDTLGHNLYVANRGGDSVSHFAIAGTGVLTLIDTLILPANTGPTSVALDPSGLFAYISDRGPSGTSQTTISQCSVSQVNGALTLLAQPTAPAGTAPADIITSR